MKSTCGVLVVVALVAVCSAEAAAAEFRGLYVDAFHPGFKDHEQVTTMVSTAGQGNFNALFVQVRKRGDAYYNPSVEPKAADTAPGYDPLADIIDQAHAAGLQVHAWLSIYEVMLQSAWSKPVGASHVYLTHPEWMTQDRDGTVEFGEGRIYLDPGVPAVTDHILAVVLDILQNYAVDGIHLDNVGYPGLQGGYNPVSVDLFNQQSGRTGLPEDGDELWCQWRRDRITKLVSEIQAAVAARKPNVVLSASVLSATPDLSAKIFLEEWDVWVRGKLVDFVVPMLFIRDDRMLPLVKDALKSSYERHMYVGIGAWQLEAELAIEHIEDARAAGAQGVVVYSYHGLTREQPNSGPTIEDLATSVFAEPASTPAMPWRQ